MLSKDETSAIRSSRWNKKGTVFAYGQSDAGSDWTTIKYKSCDGTDLPDVITKVRYSCLEWKEDGSGIFYNYYAQDGVTDGTEVTSSQNQLLYYHKMGSSQDDDIQIASFPEEPNWMSGVDRVYF